MAELVQLLTFNFDDLRSMEIWGFHNANDHMEIRQQFQKSFQFQNKAGSNLYFLNAGGGLLSFLAGGQRANLNDWRLYPVDWVREWDNFALNHQQAHNLMNTALNLPGSDLMSVDFEKPKDAQYWHYQHFNEHRAARAKLGI